MVFFYSLRRVTLECKCILSYKVFHIYVKVVVSFIDVHTFTKYIKKYNQYNPNLKMYVFWKYNENIYLMFRWGRIVDLNSVCNSVGITNITKTLTSYFSVEWEVSLQELSKSYRSLSLLKRCTSSSLFSGGQFSAQAERSRHVKT